MNLMNKKWKTTTCIVGAKCWCRLIVTTDYTKKLDQESECVIGDGAVSKKLAQHIVRLHNADMECRFLPQQKQTPSRRPR